MENTATLPPAVDLEKVNDFHELNKRAIAIYEKYNAGKTDGQTALQDYAPIRSRTIQLKREIQTKFGMTDALWKVTTKPDPAYEEAMGPYDTTINGINNHIDEIKKKMEGQKKISSVVATGQLPSESKRS